jgi:PPOX class probable F420-dependent enzyme
LNIPSTAFGERVSERLQRDIIMWLTTVDRHGRPQPRPVWFIWYEDGFLVYSRPGTYKLEHISANASVSVSLNSNERGGDIVVFLGEARMGDDMPAADEVSEYVEKYRVGMKGLGMDAKGFAREYSVPIFIKPTALRGH